MPSSPLANFLSSSKAEFLSAVRAGQDLSTWIITTGNEAGDLDSLISAVAFSYLSSLSLSTTNNKHLPLIQTSSSDLYLRPENLFALTSTNLDPSHLFCIDAIEPEVLQRAPKKGGPRYALVDHNVLLPSLSSPEGDGEEEEKVVAILDHHVDEGRHLTAQPRVIQVVGSCSSLVVAHFSSSLPGTEGFKIPQDLADLLIDAILIDTGLKPSSTGGKATQVDSDAVGFLLPFSSFSPASSLANSEATTLQAHTLLLSSKKVDVSHLSGRDLLRRDYKEYVTPLSGEGEGEVWRYGISTVPLPLAGWVSKGGWPAVREELEGWSKERGLQFVVVLTSFNVEEGKSVRKGGWGKHARELMLYVGAGAGGEKGQGRARALFEGLEKERGLDLGEWRGGEVDELRGGGEGRVWQQGNVKATRKQVAPVVKALVQAL